MFGPAQTIGLDHESRFAHKQLILGRQMLTAYESLEVIGEFVDKGVFSAKVHIIVFRFQSSKVNNGLFWLECLGNVAELILELFYFPFDSQKVLVAFPSLNHYLLLFLSFFNQLVIVGELFEVSAIVINYFNLIGS